MAKQKELEVKFLNYSGDKTIKVELVKKVSHPKYKKFIKRTFKYLVHFDSNEILTKGDKLKVKKIRRISKHKSFNFVSKVITQKGL